MKELPEKFVERMRAMLGDEYDDFEDSYERPRRSGLRVNTLKKGWEGFEREPMFGMEPILWAPHGYYYDPGARPGKHPLHEAGVYYMQEPSAMAVAALSGIKPGMRVLDLCAAPGGKSTQLASMLEGAGVLYSNEIHPTRARILSQNIERMGISNSIVTNETPERLAFAFPLYFDAVVVDAPCSGEGMFRKEEEAIPNWSPENVELCAERQKGILNCAADMTAVGGRLIYSTCTFAPQENEQNVLWFLQTHPEFEIADLREEQGEEFIGRTGLAAGVPAYAQSDADSSGLSEKLAGTLRLWPHRLEGEGHFLAVFKKTGTEYERRRPAAKTLRDKQALKLWKEFASETLTDKGTGKLAVREERSLILFGNELYLIPEAVSLDGLKVMRPGLHLGTLKKNRFEPSHALALCLNGEDVHCEAETGKDPEGDTPAASAFLRGESLTEQNGIRIRGNKGWCLVTDCGFSLGWGKLSGGQVKNHYPKGLRRPY